MITKSSRPALLALAASALLLSACGGSGDAGDDRATGGEATGAGSAGGNEAAGGEGSRTATLTMDGQSFTFTLNSCLLSDGDALVSGPGADDSGELAFLDVDYYDTSEVSGGQVRVELGTDQPFSSSDRFYSMGDVSSEGDSIQAEGRELTITAEVLENGDTSLGSGTLRASC